MAEICRSLGLEFYIGPPRTTGGSQVDSLSAPSPSNLIPGTQIQRPLTTFSERMKLPVRAWGRCSPEGHLTNPKKIAEAPAPVDLFDDEAFYGQMMDQSMLREDISGSGAYCLISPNTPLEVGERVWLRNRGAREVVRTVIDIRLSTSSMPRGTRGLPHGAYSGPVSGRIAAGNPIAPRMSRPRKEITS